MGSGTERTGACGSPMRPVEQGISFSSYTCRPPSLMTQLSLVRKHAVGGSPLSSLVRKLERYHALDAAERRAVERLSITVKKVRRGQDIIREGDNCDFSCMIMEGFAFRYSMVESGKRQIMAFCVPGDIPDLQSMALDKMDHSLGTLRACTVAEIPHRAIRDLFETQPRLAEVLWRETLIDGAAFRKWLMSVGRRSAIGCIGHIICEFVTRMKAIGRSDGITCEFPMTQTDLADAAALSLVHVNRSLRELRELGLIN
ncbi:MAG: Crp/Fnr family transcriptional regulator, partial [Xanthobacteraceae bacterium]|nr:Crp/Fnr family transcriptional regulator [Xanthobacteraceae bacterium]